MRRYPGTADVDRLIGALRGTVLEIGAGSGANFDKLPSATEWTGLEPSARARRQLACTVARTGREPRILAGPAERIPLPDGSVDEVLGTLVLCSVSDPAQVLSEVRRVLRPGGAYVFHEHVASPAGSGMLRLQRLITPVTRRLDRGCRPARETWRYLEDAGFGSLELDWFEAPGRLSWRYIAGRATV